MENENKIKKLPAEKPPEFSDLELAGVDTTSGMTKDEENKAGKNLKTVAQINKEKKRRRIALMILILLISFMGLVFIISAFQEFTGKFTINLNYNDLKEGFSLYDNRDLSDPRARLSAEPIRTITNITFDDISLEDVDNVDSSHHSYSGDTCNYFAYTFYIKNTSPSDHNYRAQLRLNDAAKNAEAAMRLLIIEDTLDYGHSANKRVFTRYALKSVAGETDVLADKSFLQDRGVIIQFDKDLPKEKVHKYTVILYLEGEDPECIDDIQGGMVQLDMQFFMDGADFSEAA